MVNHDWIWGFTGGLMIGLAGAVYLLMNGRIMGASGIVGGLVDGSGWSTWAERLAFVAALIVVPPILVPIYRVVDTHITTNWLLIIAGGLLVGVGTRLSLRGIVATVFYILAGGLTLAGFRHVLGWV